MKKRFRALRIISVIYKLLAVLALIGSIALAVLSYTQTQIGVNVTLNDALPSIIGALAGGIFGAIFFFGLGQLFDLFIALEENTRATSALLQRLGRELREMR
jgi:hypothetical protein